MNKIRLTHNSVVKERIHITRNRVVQDILIRISPVGVYKHKIYTQKDFCNMCFGC